MSNQENTKEEIVKDMVDQENQCKEENVNIEIEQDAEQDLTHEDETVEEALENSNDDKATKKEKANKSIFKNGKKEKKDPKDEKIEELNDRLIRSMAEFDNFRKRSEKEKSQMFEIGAKNIIEKILPVIDNFERGFDTITEEEKESAFTQGIEKIYKQLIGALEEVGVKPIEAVDKEFDPNFHNAVVHAEDESFGENIITDEFQKGYMYKESVVRHSMVKVVN